MVETNLQNLGSRWLILDTKVPKTIESEVKSEVREINNIAFEIEFLK